MITQLIRYFLESTKIQNEKNTKRVQTSQWIKTNP